MLPHKYITYCIQFYLSQTEDWWIPTWHGGVNKQQSPKAALILPPQKTYITSTIPVRYILFACGKKQKLEKKVLVKPIAMLLNKKWGEGTEQTIAVNDLRYLQREDIMNSWLALSHYRTLYRSRQLRFTGNLSVTKGAMQQFGGGGINKKM